MIPATQRFYEAVINRSLVARKDDEVLARHLRNAVTKTDSRGSRVVKESQTSVRKIDAAVAAIMAFDRASHVQVGAPQVWSLSETVARLQAERAAKTAGGQPAPPGSTSAVASRPDGVKFIRF
jgi:phage FluMu gp28-like protein